VDQELISRVMRELGKRGGQKKVPKGFATLSGAARSEMGRRAAAAKKKRRLQNSRVGAT
jgi:hypothetical protein